MEHVIVEVFLPAALRQYDVRLPLDLNAGVVVGMVARALSELSDGAYLPSKTSCLAWRDSGMRLEHTKTMRESGVINTSRLILI